MTIQIGKKEIELKLNILVDKDLNKRIENKDKEGKVIENNSLSGGIGKVLPLLIEEDITGLVYIYESCGKQQHKNVPTQDEILEAIEVKMEADEDASIIFKEALEVIDNSVFSRKQLAKFVSDMNLAKEMNKKDEEKADQMAMYTKRLNEKYQSLTGKELFQDLEENNQ